MAAPRRGPLARLYDAVISTTKAVGRAVFGGPRLPGGERGMARLIGPYGGSAGGSTLTRAEQVAHFRGWVYTCVDFVCTQMSREPPTAVLAADPGASRDYARKLKSWSPDRPPPAPRAFASTHWVRKSQGPAKPSEEYEFLPADDWLVRLLADPNDPDTGVSVWYEWQMYVELCGNSYLWVVEGDTGRPAELWVIPAHWVREVCEGRDKLVDYYEVRSGSGEMHVFEPDEIVALRRPSPLSKIYGHSPLQAAATTVDAYDLTEAARVQSLRNGAAVGGQIVVDPQVGMLSDDLIRRIEAAFASKYAGVHNFGRPLILDGGVSYVPPPPEQELAFMQSLDQLRKWVQGHWRLSEAALGFAGDTNRASMVAAIASAMYHVLNPRQRHAAAVLTEKLARPHRDDRCRVFWPDCTPSDADAERADWQLLVQAEAVSVNDLRTHYGLEPMEGDEYDKPGKPQPPQPPGGPGGPPSGGPDAGGGADGGPLAAMLSGMAGDADLKPGKEEKAAPDLTTKADPTPAADDADGDHDAVAHAMVEWELECRFHGQDPAAGRAAILGVLDDDAAADVEKAGAGWVAKAGKWQADLHPRDDRGQFISKDKLQAAKADPKVAEELRARTTDPAQRAKLDKIIGGEADPGRTARGERRHQAERRRLTKAQAVRRAREIAEAVGAGTATAADVQELAGHLDHLTVPQLQYLRTFTGGGAGRRKADVVQSLLAAARAATGPTQPAEPQPEPQPPPAPAPEPAGATGVGDLDALIRTATEHRAAGQHVGSNATHMDQSAADRVGQAAAYLRSIRAGQRPPDAGADALNGLLSHGGRNFFPPGEAGDRLHQQAHAVGAELAGGLSEDKAREVAANDLRMEYDEFANTYNPAAVTNPTALAILRRAGATPEGQPAAAPPEPPAKDGAPPGETGEEYRVRTIGERGRSAETVAHLMNNGHRSMTVRELREAMPEVPDDQFKAGLRRAMDAGVLRGYYDSDPRSTRFEEAGGVTGPAFGRGVSHVSAGGGTVPDPAALRAAFEAPAVPAAPAAPGSGSPPPTPPGPDDDGPIVLGNPADVATPPEPRPSQAAEQQATEPPARPATGETPAQARTRGREGRARQRAEQQASRQRAVDQRGQGGVVTPAAPKAPKWVAADPGHAAAAAEYGRATGRTRAALDAALSNAGLLDEDGNWSKIPPDPGDLPGALAGAWLELHRAGAPASETEPLERALRAAGVERVGTPGETVPFDPLTHETGGVASRGQPHRVIRPGWAQVGPDGRRRGLVQARVEPAAPPPPA